MKTNIMLSTNVLPTNEIVCEVPFVKNKFTNELQYIPLGNQKFDNSLVTQLFNTIPLILNPISTSKKEDVEFTKKDIDSLIEDYLKDLNITTVSFSKPNMLPVQVHINEFPKATSFINQKEYTIFNHIQEVSINSHEILSVMSFKFDIMQGNLSLLDMFNLIDMRNKLGIFSPKKIHSGTEYEKTVVSKLTKDSDMILSIINDRQIILKAFEHHFNFKFKEICLD